jgi:hypothetical protein
MSYKANCLDLLPHSVLLLFWSTGEAAECIGEMETHHAADGFPLLVMTHK